MQKEQKSLIKKALEFLSLSISESDVQLAKYVTTDGQEIEVADDNTTSFADGEYTLEDGSLLTVASGVATLSDPKVDEQKAADATVTDAVDPDAAQDAIDTQKIADLETKVAELVAKVTDLEKQHADLMAKNMAMSTEKETLSKQIAELEKTPAAESVNMSNNSKKELTKAELHLQRYLEENGIS